MKNSSTHTVFVPDARHTARRNLEAFIEHAMAVNAFGVSDWTAVRWNLSDIFQRNGRTAGVCINWTDLDSTKGHGAWLRNKPLPEPYASFAKAYLSYCHSQQAAFGVDGAPLLALRVLERALRQVKNTGDVTKVDANVLNTAITLAKRKWAQSTAAVVGSRLQALAEFLTAKRLTDLTLTWKSSLRHNTGQGMYRVGPEADERRKKNLPSDEVMHAMAKAFDLAVEPRDVLTSSTCALLVSAPHRIGEVLNMRRNALVSTTLDGKPTVGFEWYPEKGGKPTVKYVPPVMQDVARKAYDQLLEVTSAGHQLALWYARHPDRMFLPPDLEHLREREFLTLAETRDLLGINQKTNVRDLLGKWGIVGADRPSPRGLVRFSAAEQFVLASLPSDFPTMDRDSNLQFVDALFVVPVRFFKHGSPSRVMFMRVTYDHVVRQLGSSVDYKYSLFGRLELARSDGTPIRLRTHQVRHWLNTLARKGGLSELDIALWSGRKEVRSNAAYDDLTAEDALALVRNAAGPPNEKLVEFVVRDPISRSEFDVLKVKTGHATEFGVCVHDYAMAPCQKHRDCINCEEQVCVKGDAASNARIRHALELTEQLHRKAVEALGNNWNGAGRWEEHHFRTLKRLRELVKILDDPDVEEGSVIRLDVGGSHSILHQAMQESRRLSQAQRDTAVNAIRFFHAGGGPKQQGERAP